MRIKRNIASFLLFISILMLVMPVIPHHHHGNGIMCMKNDITTDCCHDSHSHHSAHSCCGANCPTAHFIQKVPSTVIDSNSIQPDFTWLPSFTYEAILHWLLTPDETDIKQHFYYLESLHSVCLTATGGLRAPPYLSI